MSKKNNIYQRRSIRLPDFDYATPGAYFVTICTQGNVCLFGEVTNNRMLLNEMGKMVKKVWDELPDHYPYVEIDTFVVMPNHVHGIIVITDDDIRAGFKPAPTKRHGISEIIRALKTFSSRYINKMGGELGSHLWQRGYYERVIRRTEDINLIREYIIQNPLRWSYERSEPENMPMEF